MELRPRYDGPPILDLGPTIPDPAVPMVRQRARLGTVLAGLTEDEWAHPTRCEGWSTRDVASHLITVNQFWTVSINAARAGAPTRFLTDFDPVATPAQLVEAQRHQPVAEVLAMYDATCAELAATVDGLADDQWDLPGEAPPGHIALRGVVAHALWDSWIHERDILLPLGRSPLEDADEIRASLRYAAVLGLALLVLGGHDGREVLVVEVVDPALQLTVAVGPTVVARDGLPEGEPTVRLTGSAVDVLEALSVRQPFPAGVRAAHGGLLGGLATVFGQPG
jgi:uncharacterized protein (TIGR03083 family)